MNRRVLFFLISIALVLALATLLLPFRRGAAQPARPMSQQAYVWQRAWTPAVREAVEASGKDVAGYTVLAAEVSFGSGHLEVARVSPDWAALERSEQPVGVALRIGPYHGHFAPTDITAKRLVELSTLLLTEARRSGVQPSELQIDFDCAESKLDGYQLWLESIRAAIAPTPLTFTALPSWLKHREFAALARSAGGYVLQVHSLDRPRSIEAPMTLCDVSAAVRAVEAAGRIGVPFRVALPTYGYLVAFDEHGQFVGLSAEGPNRDWPASTQVRTLSADPQAVAALVSRWQTARPACMTGLIWYRLPTNDDALNWRMPTLRAVMAGRAPAAVVRAEVRRSEGTLAEVDLQNVGDADAPFNQAVSLHWRGADLVAADAIGGFERSEGNGQLILRPSSDLSTERLAPGDRRAIGWVRLSKDKEVIADVSTIQP
jgi:hypothetical protein